MGMSANTDPAFTVFSFEHAQFVKLAAQGGPVPSRRVPSRRLFRHRPGRARQQTRTVGMPVEAPDRDRAKHTAPGLRLN
jgi:hypothetical protein